MRALEWRNKSFGQALDFVWAADANEYAVRESPAKIKIFKNFKERLVFKPAVAADTIFGGGCLAIRSAGVLLFYDWERPETLIRRIDVNARFVRRSNHCFVFSSNTVLFFASNIELLCVF